eukprot:6201370-Pleurochrysis_carterae.AAC.3
MLTHIRIVAENSDSVILFILWIDVVISSDSRRPGSSKASRSPALYLCQLRVICNRSLLKCTCINLYCRSLSYPSKRRWSSDGRWRGGECSTAQIIDADGASKSRCATDSADEDYQIRAEGFRWFHPNGEREIVTSSTARDQSIRKGQYEDKAYAIIVCQLPLRHWRSRQNPACGPTRRA